MGQSMSLGVDHGAQAIAATPLNKERHIKYWLRCLKTFLPTNYTAYDANRMMLATFILSALDVLSVLHTHTTQEERDGFVDWIYSCQHPEGGFRAFNGTDCSHGSSSGGREEETSPAEGKVSASLWDPADIAGTFFALSGLLVLGDSLGRVRRKQALRWLRNLQLEDGSFLEVASESGFPGYGRDVRFCFLAVLIRWILRTAGEEDIPDIDSEGLAHFVIASQSYDGGMAKSPYHESHAGWTYCAVSALSLLQRLQQPEGEKTQDQLRAHLSQEASVELVRWLVSKQSTTLNELVDLNDEDESLSGDDAEVTRSAFRTPRLNPPSLTRTEFSDDSAAIPSTLLARGECLWAGFSGRSNKPCDTCYSFWVGGSLSILGQFDLIDSDANRRYLIEKTQHIIGGFGKTPGDPPDILHSYLGLAALALMGEPGLKNLDPCLCISNEAKERLGSLPWRAQ